MRIKPYLILMLLFVAFLASASVPLRWTVETSRIQPAVFDVVHGESIELEAAMQSYGNPLSMAGKSVSIFWQTNGMDNAWWSAPAFVRTGRAPTPGAATPTNVLAATFTPAMDPGSATVTGFLGATGDIYRAAFTLRFRKGPGATPNVIEQPPRVLDLAHTTVINPPWPTQADFAATTSVMKAELKTYVDSEIEGAGLVTPQSVTNAAGTVASNVVTKAYVEGLGIESGLNTNSVREIVGSSNVTNDGAVAAAAADAATKYVKKDEIIERSEYAGSAEYAEYADVADYACYAYEVPWAYVTDPPDTLGSYGITDAYTMGDSDARYAPTSTAVTVANHTSQISQLSQSVTAASAKADQANIYSSGIYQYMTGNTNAWFSGTNYVTSADATNRTHFAWEPGMDAATVPCSFALWEIRDGQRQQVWDQRDWTVWYWNFKAAQMRTEIAATNAAIYAYVDSTNNHAWARRYAASGRINPDRSTTYVDTPKICLSPGMNWETVASVSGCGYWTIVGNGAVIGGSGTNAVLQIKDFEGNEVMTVTKGAHQLVWLDSNDFTGQMTDGNGWVCFDMMADAQPVGYFSTTLEAEDFTAETSANCPAQYRWENLGNGEWRVHFLLKPGIVSDACFAKFQAETQGQTTIRYNAGLVISGGLIYNGVKIVPVIPNNASAGTTITWVVAQ